MPRLRKGAKAGESVEPVSDEEAPESPAPSARKSALEGHANPRLRRIGARHAARERKAPPAEAVAADPADGTSDGTSAGTSDGMDALDRFAIELAKMRALVGRLERSIAGDVKALSETLEAVSHRVSALEQEYDAMRARPDAATTEDAGADQGSIDAQVRALNHRLTAIERSSR
jgi:hypothetical protein